MTTRWRARVVGLLWRWHRRLGLLAAAFVLLAAFSGILLNHEHELGLDQAYVRSTLLRTWYGDDAETTAAYVAGGFWVYRSAGGSIFVNDRSAGTCDGELRGAIERNGTILAACANSLLLITPEAELIETRPADGEIPGPISSVGLAGTEPAILTSQGWRVGSLDTFRFSRAVALDQVVPSTKAVMPASLRSQFATVDYWLSWERVLLDVHSGRIFGRYGPLFFDLMGLAFCVLALSGITLWGLH